MVQALLLEFGLPIVWVKVLKSPSYHLPTRSLDGMAFATIPKFETITRLKPIAFGG